MTTLSHYVFINKVQITITYACEQTFAMDVSVLHPSWRADECVCVGVCLAGDMSKSNSSRNIQMCAEGVRPLITNSSYQRLL